MKFSDIPQFPRACYEADVSWKYLEAFLDEPGMPLILEPDFQRGHVWTDDQRTAYIEYQLMGGEASRTIITNCPNWDSGSIGEWGAYEMVDGLQRVTAVRMFMANKLKAFGLYLHQFEGNIRSLDLGFRWRIMALGSRAEVLKLYLLLNAGGVVHSSEEIIRVKALLEKELAK